MIQSVWNVSVTSAALLGDDPPPIDGASRHALVRPDGTFTLDGLPVERPLPVATSGTRPIFASGRVVAAAPGFELIEPFGPMRRARTCRGPPWGRLARAASDSPHLAGATIRLPLPHNDGRPTRRHGLGPFESAGWRVDCTTPPQEQTRTAPFHRGETSLDRHADRRPTVLLPDGGVGSARAHIRLATLLKDRPPPADRNAVTITLSPPIRILGIVGILAAAALGLLLFMQSRSAHTTAATPPATAGKLHASTSAPAVRPSTRPARPAAPKIVLLPGLPEPVAHALRYSKVVVVSLYAAGASGDRAALAQARLGAASAHAGFAAVNVLNERIALGLDRFAGASSSPTVLVVRRPGRIVNRFNGYTDSDLVAQAAQNAGARGSR